MIAACATRSSAFLSATSLRPTSSVADPYHRPSNDGLPERVVQETWVRGAGISGTLELASSTHDLGGALLMRMYVEELRMWRYSAPLDQVNQSYWRSLR